MCLLSVQSLTTSKNYVNEVACAGSSSLLLHVYDYLYKNPISPRSCLFEREITTSHALPLPLFAGNELVAEFYDHVL
jgi:hypothetical protein